MASGTLQRLEAKWDLAMAEQVIEQTYGDKVSIWQKAKPLRKFGTNSDLDIGTVETIWEQGGDEVYIFTNSIDTVSSSSASDTQVLRIEGHTITGTEADPEYTFVTQTVTLNGQSKVTLDTPMARCNRMVNIGDTDLVGDVYTYQDGAITAGVPDAASTVHARIDAGLNQSRKAATTFSNTDYFVLTRIHSSVFRTGQAVSNTSLELREPGGVFREILLFTSSRDSGAKLLDLEPPIIIPKNSDIRMRANVTQNNTEVSGFFGGYLARVKGNV